MGGIISREGTRCTDGWVGTRGRSYEGRGARGAAGRAAWAEDTAPLASGGTERGRIWPGVANSSAERGAAGSNSSADSPSVSVNMDERFKLGCGIGLTAGGGVNSGSASTSRSTEESSRSSDGISMENSSSDERISISSDPGEEGAYALAGTASICNEGGGGGGGIVRICGAFGGIMGTSGAPSEGGMVDIASGLEGGMACISPDIGPSERGDITGIWSIEECGMLCGFIDRGWVCPECGAITG